MNLSSGFIALFAFSLLTAGCTSSVSTSSNSQPNSDTAIIHGKKSLSSDPIAQATVSVNTGSGKCTGVLLSDRVVLTAAHCFDFEPVELSRAKITILSGDKTQECISAAVSEVSYEPSAVVVGGVHQPDLALLKLTSA
ncbi:MAG: trypsin-like serine protease, partial [Bdellovibrionaceae bacterium]|nr:trypsin-like serine protease [Pseudobdellovibrionaceae bacterium]